MGGEGVPYAVCCLRSSSWKQLGVRWRALGATTKQHYHSCCTFKVVVMELQLLDVWRQPLGQRAAQPVVLQPHDS